VNLIRYSSPANSEFHLRSSHHSGNYFPFLIPWPSHPFNSTSSSSPHLPPSSLPLVDSSPADSREHSKSRTLEIVSPDTAVWQIEWIVNSLWSISFKKKLTAGVLQSYVLSKFYCCATCYSGICITYCRGCAVARGTDRAGQRIASVSHRTRDNKRESRSVFNFGNEIDSCVLWGGWLKKVWIMIRFRGICGWDWYGMTWYRLM